MLNLIFVICVFLLFFILGLATKAAVKYRSSVYYLYMLFIIVLIASFFPLIWIKITPQDAVDLKQLFLLSNFTVLLMLLLIDMIANKLVFDKIHASVIFFGILIGAVGAQTIFDYDKIQITWPYMNGDPIPYVKYPPFLYYSYQIYIFFGIVILGVNLGVYIRRVKKRNLDNELSRSLSKFDKPLIFFLSYHLIGFIIWFIMVLAKKMYFPQLFGIDSLTALSFLAICTAIFTRKYGDLNFLPRLLRSITIYTKSGLFIMDFNFIENRLLTFQDKDQFFKQGQESSLFVVSFNIIADSLSKHSEDYIDLEQMGLIVVRTQTLIWVFQLAHPSSLCSGYLTLVMKEFKKRFPDELGEDVPNNKEKNERLIEFIRDKFNFLHLNDA